MLSSICLFLLATSAASNPIQHYLNGEPDPKNIHAVLVSGFPCDEDGCGLSYLGDAEIAQTYHQFLEHGVPAENIILFMNGGIADNKDVNPEPGTLYTDLGKSRNWNEGLKIDYQGEDVNEDNFLAVIQGEKDKVKGGTGRVLNSTEKNRVFISHESHGDVGLLQLGEGWTTVLNLQKALKNMNEKKMFKELIYYVVSCHSGSMFADKLTSDGNIYAFTASRPDLSAFGNELLTENGKTVCINSYFGKAWLTDTAKHDTVQRTFQEQSDYVKQQIDESPTPSDPTQYGNLDIATEKLSAFFGPTQNKTSRSVIKSSAKGNTESFPISRLAIYLRAKSRLQKSTSFEEKKALTKQVQEMEQERDLIKANVDSIAYAIVDGQEWVSFAEKLRVPPKSITQMDCHHKVSKFVHKECKNIERSPFFHDFSIPMYNLCEAGKDADKIIDQMSKYCKK